MDETFGALDLWSESARAWRERHTELLPERALLARNRIAPRLSRGADDQLAVITELFLKPTSDVRRLRYLKGGLWGRLLKGGRVWKSGGDRIVHLSYQPLEFGLVLGAAGADLSRLGQRLLVLL